MPAGDPISTPLSRYAAGALGLGEGDPRPAILDRLRDDDFVPGPVTFEAISVVLGRPEIETPWLSERLASEDEERLGAEVERFAADFFSIPVADRRPRWRSLLDACSSQHFLIDRLEALAPGLDLDAGAFRDESSVVERMAAGAFALFVLRAARRAVLRRELVEGLRSDPGVPDPELYRAVNRLRWRHPSVSALDPAFLDRLEGPRRPKLKARRKPRWRPAFNLNIDAGSRPALIVFVIVALNAARALTHTSSSPPTPAPVVIPSRSPHPLGLYENYKRALRTSLESFGKRLNHKDLDRVADAAVRESSRPFPLTTAGAPLESVAGRDAQIYKTELSRVGVTLDDRQLEELARKYPPSTYGTPAMPPGLIRP